MVGVEWSKMEMKLLKKKLKKKIKLLQLVFIAITITANIYCTSFADDNEEKMIITTEKESTNLVEQEAQKNNSTSGIASTVENTEFEYERIDKDEAEQVNTGNEGNQVDTGNQDNQVNTGNKENQVNTGNEGKQKPSTNVLKTKPVISTKPIEVISLIKRIEVEAKVNTNSTLYDSYFNGKKVGIVLKNTEVVYIRDRREIWAHVRLNDGKMAWMMHKNLDISNKEFAVLEDLEKIQKNEYVNKMKYFSKTKYLVWVNIERQKTNIFMGSEGKWYLNRSFDCSTGKNTTPTVNGEFNYLRKQTKWSFFDYFVKKVMIFYDTYAFHSIPYRYNGAILDGTLNKPSSHGCIRLAQKDIDWLFEMLPIGTRIVIK